MAKASKMINGNMLFTCENSLFRTNINKGHPHGIDTQGRPEARGSHFPTYVSSWSGSKGFYTLWLENIIDIKTGRDDQYWFMWYCDGKPEISMSAGLTEDAIRETMTQLLKF